MSGSHPRGSERAALFELGRAPRALAATPGFGAAALAFVASAVAVALFLAGIFETRSPWPPLAGAKIALDPVPATPDLVAWGAYALPADRVRGEALEMFLALLAALALVSILIALANYGILVAGRALARRTEMAIRVAVGATRARLALQVAAEAVWLASLGGGLGLVLGSLLAGWARSGWPHVLAAGSPAAVDPELAVVGVLVPVAATIILSLVQAPIGRRARALWRAPARVGPPPGLGIAIFQFAALVVLLTGSALLFRSARSGLDAGRAGFDPGNTLALGLRLPAGSREKASALVERIGERVRGVAGVSSESIASAGTWIGFATADRMLVECGRCGIGGVYVPIQPAFVRHHAVSPGFFSALGVPVLRGREFGSGDGPGAPGVALVSRTFARNHFERGDPMGKRVQVGGLRGPWYEVVGIVEDLPPRGLGSAGEPVAALYLSALQHPPRAIELAVRTSGDPEAAAAAVVGTLRETDPRIAVERVSTMEGWQARAVSPVTWFARLFALFAGCAFLVALYGLYSVMALGIARRRPEIGLRRAVGARRRRIFGMVVLEGLRVSAFGAAWGLWAAVGLAGALQLLLRDVPLFDPALSLRVVAVLALTAIAGGLIPALRAARIEPARALHDE